MVRPRKHRTTVLAAMGVQRRRQSRISLSTVTVPSVMDARRGLGVVSLSIDGRIIAPSQPGLIRRPAPVLDETGQPLRRRTRAVQARTYNYTVSTTPIMIASPSTSRRVLVIANEHASEGVRLVFGTEGANMGSGVGFLLRGDHDREFFDDQAGQGGDNTQEDRMFYGPVWARRAGSVDVGVSVLEY